jgi:hypothetical protein
MIKIFAFILVAMVSVSCGSFNRHQRDERLVKQVVNSRFEVTALCSGFMFDGGFLIKEISFEDNSNHKLRTFKPSDPESLEMSRGFFTNMWSPDWSVAVLPDGRFEGFVFFASEGIVSAIENKHSIDSIVVRLSSGPMLWHEFIGWDGESRVLFSVGLSNSSSPVVYDLKAKTVYVRGMSDGSLKANNNDGSVRIIYQN